MKNNELRWARLCLAVTLTTLLTLSGLVPAYSARKQRSKRGTTVQRDVIAKRSKSSRKTRSSASRSETRSSKKSSSRVASKSKKRSGPTISGAGVSLRVGPGTGNRRLTLTAKGTKVRVLKKRNGWLQVRLPDGKTGWARADFVAGSHRVTTASAKSSTRKSKKTASRSSSRVKVAKQSSTQNRRGKRLARVIPEAEMPEATHDIVRTAYAYRGTPYRYGGSARGGFDCSGFTSYLYRKQGVSLPHSASAQFHTGRKVSRDDLQPGDLVFFSTVRKGISHVGMYVGNGKFVHSSSRRSGGVRVDSLSSGYYNERFRGARRYTR